MQKTRPRRSGKQTASAGAARPTPGTTDTAAPAGRGRPTHVRNRLIVAVAVVAAAIAAAGAPSVVAASGQLSDSQGLVTLAEQTENALTLAHSLADERDEVTAYVAAGRPKAKAPSEQRSVRVDRQVEELRADTGLPASLRDDLGAIAGLRRAALTGKSTALQTHGSYSAAITELRGLAERLAERMPARAGAGAYALAELDSAVQQAAAARGLLLAALSVPSTPRTVIDPITGIATTGRTSSDADAEQRAALSAAAQQARVRSDASLADFRDTAPDAARASYDSTVTGPEVDSAEKYLAALTDEATFSDRDLATDVRRAEAALSARVDSMRGAESALYDRRTKALAQLRDDDVTALEIRVALLGVLMLLAVGVATGMARSLTRPLAVLRLGSARLARSEDPAAEEPVKFTGRKDEFAQVVDSVNALHAHAAGLYERLATLESDRKHLVGQRQKMADAREELRGELSDSATQLERLRETIGSTFVNLALRTLGLVERQLALIEGLEEREQDPERLATLFKLDHLATVMRRHSENLLVLAGTEHVQQSAGPVPLVDVVRAAVSEIERYERVRIAALPPHAHVAGFAADDLSHLLAELMENATSFSPPDLPVEISGRLLEGGEVMLSVQDEGIGMADDRLTRLNSRLTGFDPEATYDQEGEGGLGLGLYVVARLAHRHGVRVQLREQKQGGVAAVAVLPTALLADAPATAVPSDAPHPGAGPSVSLPGADAEANSPVLPDRSKQRDPLVELAERAVRESEAAAEREGRATAAPVTEPAAEPADGGHAESPAETTMELLLPEQPSAPAPGEARAPAADPYAIGPDAHERAGDDRDDTGEREERGEPVTDKGLPKRTPKITAPPSVPRQRAGSVDAEALRRRLGGFRQGARAGHRDVEAEIAEQTGATAAPAAGTAARIESEAATGGTAEEASS
ncbi:sensor-like histidine kinase [Streptomyces zinciresistens K42]|uniref:Signal transduction histidine-protein kinase/phosphatase MprB n=1 Tax=Streptomyces zinciresistens K42 TaxID=700597 RepID=G2G530_9ACTN|nr:nitrate- and nitrite sensing domain-containing protein [Streptomyces zinciresistens]EGX61468.1 sensor-like histidine kinase [Streptomyces zinciresistens K42]